MGKGHVIPGVEQGLMGACVGEKRRIIIPPSLAYGSSGVDGIPPDSTIAFEIDIFEIYIKGSFGYVCAPALLRASVRSSFFSEHHRQPP